MTIFALKPKDLKTFKARGILRSGTSYIFELEITIVSLLPKDLFLKSGTTIKFL